MTSTKPLAGQRVIITGASRGIGRAIALRCAADGAHVAIFAKTAEPHPKLPGTINSVAEEISAAGGHALPLQVDIRDEQVVARAVETVVAEWGGIDILINNASALSLTGILDTPVKRFDLLMDVNARGTFVVSQACLPHLLRGRDPYVLTLSPPRDIPLHWFGRYLPHALTKLGMTMVALGIAEEFREAGLKSNTLWPRTLIATDAARVFFEPYYVHARQPEIVADAAYALLTTSMRKVTGQSLFDEDVLRAQGVTDFDSYAVRLGETLATDIYVD